MSAIVLNPNPIISTTPFPTSKPLFSRTLIFTKLAKKRKRIPITITMDRIVKVSSFKKTNEIEEQELCTGSSLEQDSFITGSPSFSSGFEATLNTMSKWLVTALFVAVVIVRHDATVLWAAMGSVINVLLSNVLKKIINQERPVSASKPDPGMPSSHAQSIFFIFIFSIMSMIEYFGENGMTIGLSGLILALGSYLSWLRVSQKLHTISQVLVGAAVGSVFSIFWFWSWDAFVLNAFNSSLWVRILLVIGAAGFAVGFVIYVIQNWSVERKESL